MTHDKLIARLKLQAQRASDIARQMAEDKSLRQEDNTERRTDLYMWPTPEQTTEGLAAEALTTMQAREDAPIRVLDDVQQAEAEYRLMHDRHGDGSQAAGRAWDLMRRAGDKAREALGTSGLVEREQ
jgi:hypothetical protein